MADAEGFDWEGETVLDRAGERVGKIEEIFLVEETGRPEWALVKLGRRKGHTTLVPLTRASPSEKGVAVHVAKDVIGEAPVVDADAEPSEQQVNALYRHYGIEIPTGSDSNGHGSEAGGNGALAPQAAATAVGFGNGGSPAARGDASSHGHGDLREAPIADVAKTVAGQAQTLAAQEVRLARAEMGEKVKEVGVGAGMAGGAGYVAYPRSCPRPSRR